MADGPGLRTSIYCAGCSHHCKGCHNPQSWDIANGKWMSIDEIMEVIKADTISNVSFSGGDPFFQVEAFTELARRIKTETSKTIWCWTGFTIEQIRADAHLAMLLPYIDTLVDGPFILEQRYHRACQGVAEPARYPSRACRRRYLSGSGRTCEV